MIVGAFLLVLPYIFDWISLRSINAYLEQQEKKVFETISVNGLDYYMGEDESFGSYTMLRDEYISLEPLPPNLENTNRIFNGKRLIESDTLDYRILSRVFVYEGNDYLLEIGRTRDTIDDYNTFLRRIALYVLIALVFITLILDTFFANFILRPLKRIINTNIRGRTFPFKREASRIKTTTTDFNLLNNSLIQLMDQVNKAFDREREFTANASHELLTPISILKSKIENLMLTESLDKENHIKLLDMMKILNRLSNIVRSLLLIARIDNKQFTQEDVVYIPQVIGDIESEMEDLFAEKEVKFQVLLQYQKPLKGLNTDLMFHLFSNLIRNALRYNKEGGYIKVHDKLEKEMYWICISDTGEGVPDNLSDVIFERFYTANKKVPSKLGLGLSIVNSIAKYFSLMLKVESKPGQGSTFWVGFKREQSDV